MRKKLSTIQTPSLTIGTKRKRKHIRHSQKGEQKEVKKGHLSSRKYLVCD
jgi:hypothetical protein